MGDKTGIEWTDRTWNPVRGCSRVSPGCVNCYAERTAARFRDVDQPFHGFVKTHTNGEPQWTGKLELIESKLTEPLSWRKPCRVFVNSMSDLFHEALPDEAIDRVFAVMALCPHITFQVLTKRAFRMVNYMGAHGFTLRYNEIRKWMSLISSKVKPETEWPLSNVWLGVSAENQKYADERIPLLLQTPAAVRFVSYEPALGPINFWKAIGNTTDPLFGRGDVAHLDWIIFGGESGPGARPIHPDWVKSCRDQCAAAGVAFMFKQWGQFGPWVDHHKPITSPGRIYVSGDGSKTLRVTDSPGINGFRDMAIMESVGKKKAGRLLDGREWNEFPEVPRG